MFLYRSNRAERLLEALSQRVAEPPPDPLAQECIVVQSQGMARYVAMRLAERHGVWANPAFPFPRAMLEQACDAVLGEEEGGLLDRRSMTWTIAELLWRGRGEPLFAPFAAYFEGDSRGDRLLSLAERLAALFDDYAVYRDAMVFGWQRGEAPEDPQAELFRRLLAESGATHMGMRLQRLIDALLAGADVSRLPGRVSLFGLTTLPPLYLRAFSAIGTRLPVHMFCLSPCQQYWQHIMTPERLEKVVLAQDRSAQELHLEVGHRLLSSLGTVGRELQIMLDQVGEPRDADVEAYAEPGQASMLQVLQSDILNLVERGDGSEPRHTLASDDESVQVHICHGPMREVEVLHDQLLRLLEAGDLTPEDVVVMAPDIETYAPLVAAVFGEHSGRTPIPYRLSDRSASALDPVVDALAAILHLVQGRLPLPEVLDVLSRPVVMGRFGISEDELAQLRDWAKRSGMRWGADAAHRVAVGQPESDQNTLQFGLQRLLLGLAMEGHGVYRFAGRLPFDDVEGGEGDLLGRFAAYIRTLLELHACVPTTPTVEDFVAFVLRVVSDLLDADEAYVESEQRVRRTLSELLQQAQSTGFERTVGMASLQRMLLERISEVGGARGFLSGGVTFCQMLPMRSIPFQVVVLLGMHDGSFPRASRPLSFDKQRESPQAGDRRLREDDRYLFLEAILSARRKLMISYVGRSVHDNSEWPPSVVLSELLDCLERSFEVDGGVAAHVSVEHPLSAMSPRYFSGREPRLFTYAESLRDAAQAMASERQARPFMQFAAADTLPLSDAPIELSLAQFENFVAEPLKTFMRSRLDLSLGRDAEPLESREPFEPDPLQSYQLGDAILTYLGQGYDSEVIYQALRGEGQLPLGTQGRLTFREHLQQAEAIAGRLRTLRGAGQALPTLPFELKFGRVFVRGELDQLYAERMVRGQYSNVERRSELRLWVRHLVLNYLAQHGSEEVPRETVLVGRKQRAAVSVHFSPVIDARERLQQLCAFVEDAHAGAVPFTAGTARGFVTAALDDKARTTPLSAAATAFGSSHEDKDEYLSLIIDDVRAFLADNEAAFTRHALTVFEPLLAAREERS